MTRAKTGVKGQGMVIDLMIAVLIFLLVMAAALAVWSDTASTASRRLSEREMRQMAENAFERLVRSKGSPDDWEEADCEGENLEAIGLAKRDRVLDANKVNQFIWRTQGSSHVSCEWESGFTKRKLLIEDNNYYFRLMKVDGTDDLLQNSEGDNIEAGVNPNADTTLNKGDLMMVKIRRSVTYNGGIAIAELVLHRYRK